MTDEQQQIIESIAEILTLPATDLDMESGLQDDLGLNAVEKADLLEGLVSKFGIVFEPGETSQLQTIGDLVRIIEDKMLE
ncbi:MAG: acyl carrier protein [Armatimonadetes bacterium]|nr:MAG: acyl carrier protein [Armatimonadota bacterium]